MSEKGSPLGRLCLIPRKPIRAGHGDIERVQVGPRTGLLHDRSGAPDMIRVAVSKNQVLELVLTIAASRTLPWLASGWGCRGRRLSRG